MSEITERHLRLTMSDGVSLDATVVMPEGAGPWPAVLLVHGHGEDGSKASTLPRARALAARGYLALCYSVRGQGGSEGLSFHLGARELFDLQEVVTFLKESLPVIADKVAVCGSSQGGWHAWMAAAHCDVAAVIPENIFVDYAAFAVPDGALSTWFFLRTMRRRVMSAGLQEQARRFAVDLDWERLMANLSPFSPRHFVRRIRCPVLVLHGWHDVGMPSNDLLEMFEALDVPKRMYLGGGGHEGQDDKSAVSERARLVDAWLARWLKGEALPEELPITVAVRPSWQHVSVSALSPSRSDSLWLHLGGVLSESPPSEPMPNCNVNHQPRDPDYTLSVALNRDLAGTREAWPREEVVFDGPALEEELELRGCVRFLLHVLPERPFFQVHAELWDVAPDGQATLVTRGHQGHRSASAGAHLQLQIDARVIAYRMPEGHKLRVIIADQNPDYVVPVYRPYRMRLFCELGRASCVVLPVYTD